ncbi:MAG: UDP-3-O-(3-hydroxymyristoyl)glucosamine N-acyltransferase [Elusimicrobiota bacterium]|nr:UDP-3-O-(3-hydroxymyristoyl)glucosamine N-acyltransferase [Endomicrobiia bacterium]MDW8166069.1 UDP-3-O-(3-hydroxymyristoyl)glucosamine N-acyltransferase [Elusimicrobiota bacterium]
MNFKLKEIAKIIDGEIYGDENIEIININEIENAQEREICVLRDIKKKDLLRNTKAAAVVVPQKIEDLKISQIVVDDIELAFIKLLNIVFEEKQKFYKGIHSTVILGYNVKIGKNVSIGPYCVIEENVEILDNTKITSFVYIGRNVKIGKNVIIYPNVTIKEDTIIGNNVIIHSGTVIGSDGFGYVKRDNTYKKIPQIGKVVIEDDVEIGANVTIDRATISETKIAKGTKIDNLVHIAHNVKIGENVLILAQVGIAGSSKIGKNSILAGQTGVIDHICVGENVVAGPRTGIVQDVESNKVVWGTPPVPFEEQKKIAIASRRLPRLLKEFSEIKKKIEEIYNKVLGV